MKVGLDDFFAAGHTVADLMALVEDQLRPLSASNVGDIDEGDTSLGVPTIQVSERQLRDVSDDAVTALKDANEPPTVFHRGDGLVRVVRDDRRRELIQTYSQSTMRSRLARVATWLQSRRQKGGRVPEEAFPPKDVVDDVLALGEWPGIPRLAGLAHAPVLTRAGSILATPGYDAESGLLYVGEPFDVRDGPPDPTELQAAVGLILDDLLADMPFAGQADRAHALAFGLLGFVRHHIEGPTPLFVADAPVHGSGKGLLVDVLARPTNPDGPRLLPPPTDDAEARKKITSVLMAGETHPCFDNVAGRADLPSLAAALTAEVWSDRMLGHNRIVTLPNQAIWSVTANNLALSEELARRVYRCRLDPRTEQPWTRAGFRYPDLRLWAREHRRELVLAMLTLVRAWLAAGNPTWSGRALGSFEEWSRVIGGILEVCGVPGFLGNADEVWAEADPYSEGWRVFVTAWADRFGREPVTAADLLGLHDQIGSDIVGTDTKSRVRVLAQALRSRRDRVIAGWRIVRASDVSAGQAKGSAQWSLEPPGSATGSLSPRSDVASTSVEPDTRGLRGLSSLPTPGEQMSAVSPHRVGPEISPLSPLEVVLPLMNPGTNGSVSPDAPPAEHKVSNLSADSDGHREHCSPTAPGDPCPLCSAALHSSVLGEYLVCTASGCGFRLSLDGPSLQIEQAVTTGSDPDLSSASTPWWMTDESPTEDRW